MEPEQAFLESTVMALVDYPDSVKIAREVDDRGILLWLTVHKNDMGKIVGRGGQNAKAIRALLRVIGARTHTHVGLKIEEPSGGLHDLEKQEVTSDDFHKESARSAFGSIAQELQAL